MLKAKEIMTKDVITVQCNEGLDKIYEIMCEAPFRHLPILDGDRLVGMVSNRDLLSLTHKK